jgi:hypothetical protein
MRSLDILSTSSVRAIEGWRPRAGLELTGPFGAIGIGR